MTQVFPAIIRYFVMVFGNTVESHKTFMDHLTISGKIDEVSLLNESNVIIAFVPIVSRAGTDISAAMEKIPDDKPVVLVVLHHTFNGDFVAPDSKLCVNRDKVFAVDCLFHEDQGLLRCQRNDEAINAVKKHLIGEDHSEVEVDPRYLRRILLEMNGFVGAFVGGIRSVVVRGYVGVVEGGIVGVVLGGFVGGVLGGFVGGFVGGFEGGSVGGFEGAVVGVVVGGFVGVFLGIIVDLFGHRNAGGIGGVMPTPTPAPVPAPIPTQTTKFTPATTLESMHYTSQEHQPTNNMATYPHVL